MSESAGQECVDAPYYAETAFNSQNVRPSMPRRDLSGEGYFTRKAYGNPLPLRGDECREFASISRELRSLSSFQKRTRSKEGVWSLGLAEVYKHHKWVGALELASVIVYLHFFSQILIYTAIASMVLILIFVGPTDRGYELMNTSAVYLATLIAIWLIARTPIYRGWVTLKRDTRLIRPTGMISYWAGRKVGRVEMPFVQFEPYARRMTNYGGGTSYELLLVHRKEDIVIPAPHTLRGIWQAHLTWEELYRFMDTSQPLPDTPEYECTRHLDPVTADHDRRHGRPERYWRELDPERGREIENRAIAAARSFPWGRSRQQAIARGWSPSGVGEGDWRNG